MKPLLAILAVAALMLAGCQGKPAPPPRFASTLQNCTDALDKQSEAIKALEDALSITEKQRDRLLKDVQLDVKTMEGQKALIDLHQSEWTREHSVPITIPGPSTPVKNCCPEAICICDDARSPMGVIPTPDTRYGKGW